MLDDTTLGQIFAEDADGLAALRAAPASGRVDAIESPGGPVVRVDGRRLHSGRDPAREARRRVRELDLGNATVVVLLGLGSGYLARELAARTSATIFAFEPDLDVLREGLTHGPLPESLRVITTTHRLGQALYARLNGCDQGVIVVWPPSQRTAPELYAEGLARTREAVDRASLRHRTAKLRARGWLRHYLHNLPNVARAPGLPALRGGLAGVPAIIVAAGPSLDRNVETLREVGDDALILVVNTAASALAAAGVRPHALVAIESLDVTPQLSKLPWLRDIPAFLELTGNPALWDLPFRAKLPISVDTSACAVFSTSIDPLHGISAGFCVANCATAIAHALGCNPIVLVGSDLAFTDDRVYATATSFESMRARSVGPGEVELEGIASKRAIEDRSADAASGNHMPTTAKTKVVPGWGGGAAVTTSRDFAMFRDWYSYAAETLCRDGVAAINATEGGAHIDGWEHVPLRAVVERYRLGSGAGEARARFEALLERAPTAAATVAGAVADELRRARELADLADEALTLTGDDPDGDLDMDDRAIARLGEIGTAVRELLHRSPLAGEATFVPVDDVRARAEITAYSFYSALAGPLRDLQKDLARLLQCLQDDEFCRAS